MQQKGVSKEKIFPELLKYQRELRGWSQAKMAEEIGASPNRISSWERGIALPSAYFREKLCLLLNMNAQELGLLDVPKEEVLSEEPILPHSFNCIDSVSPLQPVQRNWFTNSAYPFIVEKMRSRNSVFFVLTGIVLVGLLSILFYGILVRLLPASQVNPYVPNVGRLVLHDALQDQSQNVNWQEGINDQQASCIFKEGGYVAFQPLAGHFHACSAQKTDYTNFAYEVRMTIQQGEFGGIIFRAEDSIDAHYYLFRVHTNGTYWVYRFADRNIEDATLLDHGSLRSFSRGSDKTNRLAVVAQASSLTFYVNGQRISTLQDAGYVHGQIGVLAGSMGQGPSQALFQDVNVWAW